jgi:iron-sulfur cluster insertion protein
MEETTPLSLSKRAAQRVLELIGLGAAAQHSMLRISVISGGCSGLQYNFCLDNQHTPEDNIFKSHGACFIVDNISLPFLQGAEIDYVEELIGSNFVIRNPNALASCGCGSSFSI